MKKRIEFCLLALLTGIGSVYADITIRAKVPAEWTNNIYGYIYTPTSERAWFDTTHDGEWYSFTYTGTESSIGVIMVNNTTKVMPTNKNDQTTNIASVTADKCIEISYSATTTDKSTWTEVDPATVSFVSLGTTIGLNTDVRFSAVSEHINGFGQPATSYRFYVKKGSGSYSLISAGHYQFAETGTYTVRVRAYNNEEIQKAELEQSVEVIDANTIYYVKTNDWEQVNAYMWVGDAKNKNWPGELMTLTSTTTARNNYPVYAVAYEAEYANIIFNDYNNKDSETGNLSLNTTTPYYYDGEWYASLDDCDQPVLTTDFYLAGSFNSWSMTADRFMKTEEDDTEASVTINVSAYSNITFKVVEDGGWCGASAMLTKDENTVTIADKGSGVNIGLTPYAAGDYIFTLNLENRLLTVTYPDGEQMEIPTNIFLACDVLNNWAPADENYKFDVDEENDIATLELTLDEETAYAFKLVYNDAWMGANYNFKYYWNTDIIMTAGATQANLYSFKAGTYTFRYSLSTSELTIVYPATNATPITLSSYEYATLYSDIAFDVPEEVEAYIITGCEGIILTMERIYRIPEQTGVLLHAAAGTYDFYEGDGRWMDPATGNKLKGSIVDELVDNSFVHYVLSYDENNKVGLFWPYGTGATSGVGAFTNNAGKAYLELGETPAAAVVARRGFPLGHGAGMPTAIDQTNLESDIRNQKLIKDGQLIIEHNGYRYNAQGTRMQ